MKALTRMTTIAKVLLAFAPNQSRRISTTSFISGFSPSTAPIKCFRNTGLRSIDPFFKKEVGVSTGGLFSEHQGDCSDCEENHAVIIEGGNEYNWLVVGDGDFSYSATIAEDLAKKSTRLFATVLEDEDVHDAVYKRSSQNKAAILSCRKRNGSSNISNTTRSSDSPTTASTAETFLSQHRVRFGIDATRLKDFFPSQKFHVIEFNFPHWGGKTNAKRNRQLVDSFMASASKVLHKEGEITISLCEGQGGFPASNADEWKQSWLVPEYAAQHGLLLRKLTPYEPLYQQTSHRGKDRPWIKDGTAQRYTFTFPNQQCIDRDLQISCRHELRIVLPAAFTEGPRVSRDEIIEGDAVFELTKNFVPEGIGMEVVEREILQPYVFNGEEVTLAIFLLNYSGESMPLTRNAADSIRSQLEASVCEQWELEIAKGGRLVSRPYPTHLLASLIKESYERKANANINAP